MLVSLLTLALVAPTQAHGDTLQQRVGLYVGFGLGPAYLHYDCSGCPQKGSGLATYGVGRIGVAVSRHFTVGLDLHSWHRQGTTDGASNTILVVNYYPDAEGGTFLRAGAGVSSFRGIDYADGPHESGSGTALAFGAGYDARIDKKLSLTPELGLLYNDIGTTSIVGFPERRGTRAWLVAFSIGLTWH
jgi:hypothetical protein